MTILLERYDVDRIGLDPYWFLIQWDPGSPEAMALDYLAMPSPGPFLLKVHDEAAWVSHGQDSNWRKVAQRYRYDCEPQRKWGMLVKLYAAECGLTQMSFLGRWASVRREARLTPNTWVSWDKVCPWPDVSFLMWSGIIYHPWLDTRETLGRKEVRYGSRR